MSQQQPSLYEETRSALAGSWRLVAGRRDAPGYFFTDLRGLASSFIGGRGLGEGRAGEDKPGGRPGRGASARRCPPFRGEAYTLFR